MNIQSSEDFQNFENLESGEKEDESVRRRYSVTGDILSYRRCSRQYGHFSEYNYSPARAAQLWFGQVVHETLDRAHRHYKGQLPETDEEEIPTDEEIEEYFNQIHESLKSKGLEPMSQKAKQRALQYIQRFNREKGPELYQKVRDTEHRLEKQDRERDFVMEGVVDVLVREEDEADDPSNWEIWDYKASSPPDQDESDEEGVMNDYEEYKYQMMVYAGLFKRKNGSYPAKAVLYFLGADDEENAKVEFNFEEERDEIDTAIEIFGRTVEDIRSSRKKNDWSETKKPSKETCAACDIRYDCPLRKGEYEREAP